MARLLLGSLHHSQPTMVSCTQPSDVECGTREQPMQNVEVAMNRSYLMRMYAVGRREFILLFAVFCICFVLCVAVGQSGPPVTSTMTINATSLSSVVNNSNATSGPFILKSPVVSVYSRQLWLTAYFVLKENHLKESVSKMLQVSVAVRGITVRSQQLVILNEDHSYSHFSELRCTEKVCDEILVLHLGFLDHPCYLIVANITGLEIPQKFPYSFEEIIFQFTSYNTAFTQYEIYIRFSLLLLTLFVMFRFVRALQRIPLPFWCSEQRWMAALLPMLLLFNDPMFAMSYLLRCWLPDILEAVFHASFLALLLFFWLFMWHHYWQQQTEVKMAAFLVPKISLTGLLWLVVSILASWQKYNEFRGPLLGRRADISALTALRIVLFMLGSVYIIYLLYLVAKAFTRVHAMPYAEKLQKVLVVSLQLVVLSTCIHIMLARYGLVALDYNPAGQLVPNYGSSLELVLFFGLLNSYHYIMAYLFMPHPKAALSKALAALKAAEGSHV